MRTRGHVAVDDPSLPASPGAPRILYLGRSEYLPVWQRMKAFTASRDAQSIDEIWITEHPSVFTQGQNGRPEHLIDSGDIPVIPVDRGGQVTYHGPGQLVVYCLLDLVRLGIGVRTLVTHLENAVIDFLAGYGVEAASRSDAPGVYVGAAKIAALGLRVRKGRCYHGLSLNLDMDLSPFERINPCGYAGLEVTQLSEFNLYPGVEKAGRRIAELLIGNLYRG